MLFIDEIDEFLDEIDAGECGLVFVTLVSAVDDKFTFEVITLVSETLVHGEFVAQSRKGIEAMRNELIDELDVRDIEVVKDKNTDMVAMDDIDDLAMMEW